MNWRKPSKGLTSKERSFIGDTVHEAKRARTPLTIWLTLTAPARIASNPALTASWFRKMRNKAGVEARRNGYPSVIVWTIEANKDGSNPHMNLLVHVPPEEYEGFLKVALNWMPDGGVLWDEIDPNRDLVGYITKQLDYQARYRPDGKHLPYKPGLYHGKRCGASRALIKGPAKARRSPVAAYQEPQQSRAA